MKWWLISLPVKYICQINVPFSCLKKATNVVGYNISSRVKVKSSGLARSSLANCTLLTVMNVWYQLFNFIIMILLLLFLCFWLNSSSFWNIFSDRFFVIMEILHGYWNKEVQIACTLWKGLHCWREEAMRPAM